MSFVCSPLTLINPLHHERCTASSPHGGVCPESIDFTKRVSAHLELALSKAESKPETRARNFSIAARLMICDNHENRLREACRIARRWEEHAAQQSSPIIRSLVSTEIPTYKQSPQSQISSEGGIMRQSVSMSVMFSELVTRCRTRLIQARLRAFGHLGSEQEQLLYQQAMAYTEANLHEKACKIWLALLQACPPLLDDAFPKNNLDFDWIECQKAATYTENGLHDEACKRWIALLHGESTRSVFQEGFLRAIQPLPTNQRLNLLQLVKNNDAVLWLDHAIAMEYYSRKDYERAYQAFSFLFESQPIKALTDANIPLINSIISGDRILIKERLQQLPPTLKSVDLRLRSNILECCDSLLEIGYIEESAELWIQCARNDDGHPGTFLSRLCKSLHSEREIQVYLPTWRALVEANPNSPLILKEFKAACAAHSDHIATLHTLQQLVARFPENNRLFSMLVQNLEPADDKRRLAVWRNLAADFPHNRHFQNELYLALSVGTNNFDSLCTICAAKDNDTCFLSCGHFCCTQCAALIDKCHVCREAIKKRVKIWGRISHY